MTQTNLLVNLIGFNIGDLLEKYLPTVISVSLKVVLVLVILFVGLKLIKYIVKLVRRALEKSNVEVGVVSFLSSLLKYILYFVLVMIILAQFGIAASSVVAVLGSVGLTIGLALQGSLSNFAGGVLILLLKPFKVGDYIIACGQEGTVEDISIFYTRLSTGDNKKIVIPNGTLSNENITNVSAVKERRIDLCVGVAYESNLAQVKEVLSSVVFEDEAVLKEKDKVVFVSELADSSVNMGVRVWVKSEDYWTAKWRMTENIKNALDENHISIPYPQLDVQIKQ